MPPKIISAKVESITPLSSSILQLILSPEFYVEYQPGQYLDILFANQFLSYSIANAPLGSRKYELHIRHSADNEANQQLLAEIKSKGEVRLRLPLGDCHLCKLKSEQPILFIAGGTGFAPIKAMIEQLLASDDPRSFELFWGARSKNDLYMSEKVNHWQNHASQFRYFSLLPYSDHKDSLVALVLDRHSRDLNNWQFVLSGPFDMVFATRDVLLAQGLAKEQLFSDAFALGGE